MKDTARQIWVAIILIVIVILATYSIHLANYREYTRSEGGEFITYPRDILLSWYEKVAAQIGEILGLVVIFAFCYLFFMGVSTFYTKFFSKYNISKVLIYLFAIWILAIGVYSLATSQFGQSFILEPFFGKKIYFGH